MSLWDRPNGPGTGAALSATQTPLNVHAVGAAELPVLQLVLTAAETKIFVPQNPLIALVVPLSPNTPTLEQTIFDLVVSGYIKTTGASTIQLGLYADALLAITAGNLLHKTAAATAQNTASAPFFIHGTFIYDSVSGKLQGKVGGMINNVIDPDIAVSNQIVGISNTGNPVLNFSLSVTSSGATAVLPTSINIMKFNAG
jgi:hypothetical protein